MEKNQGLEVLRRQWYNNPIILFQIIENLKYRETVFLRKGCCHRCIKANAVRFLQMNFSRYKFMDEPFNLYGSLAHYPDMPSFSFNRVEKRKEMDRFNKEYGGYLDKYDFMFDIDNPDIDEAHQSLIKILPFFADIPYYVVFSGTKGFHIRVDYEDFPQKFKAMNFPELADLFKRFAENFSLINNLPDIDYSIFDLRRIAKTPYSVVYYQDEPSRIALPMTDEMINKFNIDEYDLKFCLSHLMRWRNRGLLKRNGNPEKFKKLIEEYSDLK